MIFLHDSVVKDPSLAEMGEQRIEWARRHMPVLEKIKEFERKAAKKLEATEVAAESPNQPADMTDDITGQPIEAETVADPAMAEDSHHLPEMQFDKDDSMPELEEEKTVFQGPVRRRHCCCRSRRGRGRHRT